MITHAVSTAAHFLGYDIGYQQSNDKICAGRRSVNGHMGLRVPKDAIDRRCRRYMDKGKPERRAYLIHESDFAIVLRYQAEYRGVVQYYQLATNIAALGRLHYVMETSLLKTLANKHKATVTAMARKYRATADTPYGPMTCLRVQIDRTDKPALVAEFGGIPLRVVKTARTISDTPPEIWTKRTDIVDRLLADRCELCGQEGRCEVHHIRKMADLHRKGRKDKPAWMQRMSAMRRKTLVVCPPCHDAIHAGRLQRQGHTEEVTGEPCNAKVLSTVQREADGKVPAC